ncbi:E4 ORF6/7 [Mastadenovirus eidoli]|uniref:E4 ORF6/7 n=1 Tax=Eidolon helvum adenovirus TaxID=2039267 RepID=A0A348FKH8_9ADEN|nr:E4 ORF6/7 [Eidolon helvum adenovirus]BBF72845.1 E4 ORF6/7 [Eidolon helvum adenovirus]
MDACFGREHLVGEEPEAVTLQEKDIPDKLINIADLAYAHRTVNFTFKGTIIGTNAYIFTDDYSVSAGKGYVSVITNSHGGRIIIHFND